MVECQVRYNRVDDVNMSYLDLVGREGGKDQKYKFLELKSTRDILVCISTEEGLDLDTSD